VIFVLSGSPELLGLGANFKEEDSATALQFLQRFGELLRHIDPAELVTLGRLLAAADKAALHLHEAAVEVEVAPLQAEQLAHAHARPDSGHVERMRVVTVSLGRL